MNANEVLTDLLEDNRRRLRRVFAAMGDECVLWQPEAEANSIAVTVWHMARMFDVFLTQQAQGRPAADECWHKLGWAEQTGYDPRGAGQHGWGMLTGYTQAEVAAVPQLTREQLLCYFDEVYDAVRDYLAGIAMDQLLSPAAGFEGKYTQYQCIQMALMDNVRHLGEIYAIKASWERQVKQASQVGAAGPR